MTDVNACLTRLLERERAKKETHSVVLGVQTADGLVDFRGSAGDVAAGTRFFAASVTKMFTATLIMKLVGQGRLSLDETVQSFLPECDLAGLHVVNGVDYSKKLTLRQVLGQTSGLADYYEAGMINTLRQGQDAAFSLSTVLELTKNLTPQSAPDTGRAYYSDTNYQLLGAVIEAVTGASFAACVETMICAPLGLHQTKIFDLRDLDACSIMPLYYRSQRIDLPMTLTSMKADGGIVSTLDDLLTFMRAVHENRLVDQHLSTQMQLWRPLFFPLDYGFGLMRFRFPRFLNFFLRAPVLIGHSGSSASFAFVAPESGTYLVGNFSQLDQPRRPFGLMIRVLRCLSSKGVGR